MLIHDPNKNRDIKSSGTAIVGAILQGAIGSHHGHLRLLPRESASALDVLLEARHHANSGVWASNSKPNKRSRHPQERPVIGVFDLLLGLAGQNLKGRFVGGGPLSTMVCRFNGACPLPDVWFHISGGALTSDLSQERQSLMDVFTGAGGNSVTLCSTAREDQKLDLCS